MQTLVLLLALTAYKPDFDKQYFTKCMDGEDADSCKRRQDRWNEAMAQYRKEVAEERDRELAYLKDDAAKLEVKPLEGREKVGPMAPKWCKATTDVPEGDLSGLRRIGRSISTFSEQRYFSFQPAVFSAESMCFAPDNEDVKKLAGALVQTLVNTIGYSADEAVADLTARLDEKGLTASKKKLCEALKVSEEAEGDVKALAQSKWLLFGCDENDKLDSGLWLGTGGLDVTAITYFLDSGPQAESEAMLLAYLLAVTRNSDSIAESPFYAMDYAMVQLDLAAFDAARLQKELSGEPFAGNTWAKLLIAENIGSLKRQTASYQAAINKLLKDEGWKSVLVEAPKKGVKDWTARAEKFKAALEHSREFEKKAFGPSRKAVKGCSTVLRQDFGAYLKTVKSESSREFSQAVVGDPVGSLLLMRLAACEAAEGHGFAAGMYKESWEEGRVMRGPRFAAMYAAIEALGEVKKDRPKFPLEPSSVHVPSNDELMKRFDDGIQSVGIKSYDIHNMYGSVVKSVSKQGDQVKVVFITEKFVVPAHICVDTNRIMRIEPNGQILYYRNCTFGKQMETITQHMDDLVLPADLAAGIKPGAYVEVSSSRTVAVAVYADKTQKKLVAWRGFGL